MLRKAALLAAAYLVIQTLPDLARYMKIRKDVMAADWEDAELTDPQGVFGIRRDI